VGRNSFGSRPPLKGRSIWAARDRRFIHGRVIAAPEDGQDKGLHRTVFSRQDSCISLALNLRPVHIMRERGGGMGRKE
jgi:hypothetical protein